MKPLRSLVLAAACCLPVITTFAGTFNENFNSSNLSTNLVVIAGPGCSFIQSAASGLAQKQAGAPAGSVFVNTKFDVRGDFTATVQAGIINLGTPAAPAALGLLVQALGGYNQGYATIYFNSTNQIRADLWTLSSTRVHSLAQPASYASFRIVRSGNTLSLQYNLGAGYQTLSSDTNVNLAIPLKVSLFLADNVGFVARSGWFDDWTITADQFFTGTPGLGVTATPAAMLVRWPTVLNNQYQLLCRPALNTNAWQTVGSPLAGTGGEIVLTNWTGGDPRRYYRVEQTNAPQTTVRLAPAADQVSWPTTLNNHYQVLYRSALTGNAWTPLGSPWLGTGSTITLTNWVIGQPAVGYNVIESP